MEINTHICNEDHSWALDNKFRRFFQPTDKILQHLSLNGKRIVDLGCGPGYFTIPMAIAAGEKGLVTAVDVQAAMLVKVKNKIAGSPLEEKIVFHACPGDIIGLKEQFDLVFAFWMIHEVPDREKYINEIYKLLDNKGIFFMAEPKGHVKKSFFEESVNMAKREGFTVVDFPHVKFSRAVKLVKNSVEQ